MLKKLKIVTLYHYIDGERVGGAHGDITGNLSGVTGEITGVTGNLSGIRGHLSGITGNLTGIRGDLSGIRGNLDECGITEHDRLRGVEVEDLVE